MLRAIGLLLLALVLSGPAHAALDEKRVALVIGNDAYKGLKKLDNGVNDARAMERELKGLGFETLLKVNAGRKEMYAAISEFGGKLASGSVGLFYYAGHGIQADNKNFLIPVDAELQSEDDLLSDAIDIGRVMQAMEAARNRLNIVVLDACRDNPLPKGGRSGTRGLAVVQAPTGTLVAYATGPGKVAQDGDKGGNGVYTGELIKALREPGLTIEQVFKKAGARVVERTGGKQVPWMQASVSGDFYLRPGSAAPAPSAGGGADKETVFWQSIQGSKDAGDYEAYLAQYPNGAFATLARKRAEDLKGNKIAALVPPRADVALEAMDREMVAARKASVREAPEAKAKLVASLSEGDTVQVTGKVKGENWFAVTRKGQGGYVVSDTLEEASAFKARRQAEAAAEEERRRQAAAEAEAGAERQRQQVAALAAANAEAERQRKRQEEMTPGRTFRECPDCPEMVVVPAGSFMMGIPSSETGRYDRPAPQHWVTIGYSFAVGKYEVTQEEWQSVMGGNPSKFQGPRNPVEKVSWNDAQEFIRRLNAKVRAAQTVSTGGDGPYRLLSEAEWEYAARAGTTTMYSWGDSPGSGNANCHDCGSVWDFKQTAPVGSFRANGFGLHDMHGNVSEWVQDYYADSYAGTPSDGSAAPGQNLRLNVIRGGSWETYRGQARSGSRVEVPQGFLAGAIGFRLARTL